MNSAPRLSVGLPVYNAQDTLAESLDALLGQSYQDFELVISDNASTDGTADLCREYARQDGRIRYLRQPRNLGRVPNHNLVIGEARGEFFKWAAGDDLYARDLLKLCVEALDANPQVVLAHTRSAIVDRGGNILKLVAYPPATDAVRAPERFRSMLFDGWGDDSYGVIRTAVLRRTPLHGSYLNADRTFSIEIALHGPFYQVPDVLFFRRDAAPRETPFTVRTRCAYMDPRRGDRLRHPAARLYGEYAWAYVSMIKRAPLSAGDQLECYLHLTRWCAGRSLPLAGRIVRRKPLPFEEIVPDPAQTLAAQSPPSVDAVVPGREGRKS